MTDEVWKLLSDTSESLGFSLGDAVALWQVCKGDPIAYMQAACVFSPEDFYAVRGVLAVHPHPDDVLDRFYRVLDLLGAEAVAQNIANYLPCDDVPEFNLGDFADWLARAYDL